jgi:hypothetical protein
LEESIAKERLAEEKLAKALSDNEALKSESENYKNAYIDLESEFAMLKHR